MGTNDVIAVGFASAGVGAMVVYFHMDRRERHREMNLQYGRGSLIHRFTEWVTFAAMPGVIAGLVFGGVAWLVVDLVLLALGVVH